MKSLMVLLVFSSAMVGLGHADMWSGVGEWIVGAADTINPVKVVQRTMDDKFQTVGKFALNVGESVPVIGHGIYVVQLARGDVEAANRALASANSGAAAVAGGALGTLCGPAAMVCVPVFTVAAQTGMDAVNTVVYDKQSGNIEYFANFKDKSGWEHAAFAGAFVLDAVTAGKGGKIVFKPTNNVKNIDDVGKSISKNINEVHVPEMTKYVDADKNVPSKTVNSVNDKQFGNNAAGTAGSSPDILVTNDEMLHKSFENVFKKTIAYVEQKFTVLHVQKKYDIDYYSEIDLYNGPIIEFQPNGLATNEYVKRMDLAARDMIIDPTMELGMKTGLEIRALYIKTDYRASKFPELNNFPDKMLYNVKLDDLIDYNVGQSFDEINMNCMRLSISKVFNVDYNNMKKEFLPLDKPLDKNVYDDFTRHSYELSLKRTENILKRNSLKYYDYKLAVNEDPTSALKTFMKNKNLKEIHAIVLVDRPNGGHAMTIRATANGDDEILHIIVDHQVNVGHRVQPDTSNIPARPPLPDKPHQLEVIAKENQFVDAVHSGKRFTQLSDWKNIGYTVMGFIFNVE
ncbi:hypothetical protein ACI65C_000042 [Semiaphis heraclei]